MFRLAPVTVFSYAPAVLVRASKWRVLSRQPTNTKKETKVDLFCFVVIRLDIYSNLTVPCLRQRDIIL